jgi:hypothetical protein
MEVHHEQVQGDRRNPHSHIELDAWLAVAKEVLGGNEGPHGETRMQMSKDVLFLC